MSSKPVNVDYGPLTLTVGETAADNDAPRSADEGAPERFRAAVGASPRRRTPQDDEERGRLASPFDLLGEVGPERRATAGEVGAEIAQLWVSDLSSGAREVRAVIAPALLPHTSVHLAEEAGRLQVELRVGCDETRRWLSFSLPALGRDLGARMQRDVLVLLFDAREDDPVQRFRWPEDEGQR